LPAAPGAATVPRHARCIPAEFDAAAAWQNEEPGKYSQMPIIFAVGRDCLSFDHEPGSDREALRQTVQLVTY
jgi:hypothetical protein